MSARDTDSLEPAEAPTAEVKPPVRAAVPEPAEDMVHVHYPEPTALGVIVKDVARWSGRAFVMEPSANVRIQIFSPRALRREDAYMLFLTSLSVVHLRAVQIGQVVKIVPVTLVIAA